MCDLLEESMATLSSILTGESHGEKEKPDGLQSIGLQSQTQLKQLSTHLCMHKHKMYHLYYMYVYRERLILRNWLILRIGKSEIHSPVWQPGNSGRK